MLGHLSTRLRTSVEKEGKIVSAHSAVCQDSCTYLCPQDTRGLPEIIVGILGMHCKGDLFMLKQAICCGTLQPNSKLQVQLSHDLTSFNSFLHSCELQGPMFYTECWIPVPLHSPELKLISKQTSSPSSSTLSGDVAYPPW